MTSAQAILEYARQQLTNCKTSTGKPGSSPVHKVRRKVYIGIEAAEVSALTELFLDKDGGNQHSLQVEATTAIRDLFSFSAGDAPDNVAYLFPHTTPHPFVAEGENKPVTPPTVLVPYSPADMHRTCSGLKKQFACPNWDCSLGHDCSDCTKREEHWTQMSIKVKPSREWVMQWLRRQCWEYRRESLTTEQVDELRLIEENVFHRHLHGTKEGRRALIKKTFDQHFSGIRLNGLEGMYLSGELKPHD